MAPVLAVSEVHNPKSFAARRLLLKYHLDQRVAGRCNGRTPFGNRERAVPPHLVDRPNAPTT